MLKPNSLTQIAIPQAPMYASRMSTLSEALGHFAMSEPEYRFLTNVHCRRLSKYPNNWRQLAESESLRGYVEYSAECPKCGRWHRFTPDQKPTKQQLAINDTGHTLIQVIEILTRK